MPKHFIWWFLTIACVIWYLAITWYVAIRGAKDIKDMLSNIKRKAAYDENSNGKNK